MRLCRFDAGAGGYLARETETETETGARRHGHADGRAAALACPQRDHSTLGHNPSQLIVHARLVRNVG